MYALGELVARDNFGKLSEENKAGAQRDGTFTPEVKDASRRTAPEQPRYNSIGIGDDTHLSNTSGVRAPAS